MNILAPAIIKLIREDRFYAEILLQMTKIISKEIPTAGVRIKDNIELIVNPDFFEKLSIEEQIALLKHECQHILNDHISRSKELAPEVYDKNASLEDSIINQMKHKGINVAADLAINPGIKDIPMSGVFPKMFDLPDGETLEWYMSKLKDNDKCKGLTEFDGHPLWAESEGEKEEIKEVIKNAITKAANKTREAGQLSSEHELLISRLNRKSKDWKSELRRFVSRTLEYNIDTTRKKRNRRYGIMYPGIRKEPILNIGVAMDTSGSVSDEALCQFMAEINNISKYAVITVVEADSEVKNSYIFDPKKKYKIKGRGGTAYNPALEYFTKETKVDGVIYFGDMDCFDSETIIKPKYPVLWAIVGNQEPPVSWGSKTRVEVDVG